MKINASLYYILFCPYLSQLQAVGTKARRLIFATNPTGKAASTESEDEKEKKKKEEEEEKKTQADAKEKDKKKTEEEKKKEKAESGEGDSENVDVKGTTERIGKQAAEAAAFAKSGKQVLEATEGEKESLHALKMGELATEFAVLNEEDEKIRKPVSKYLEELVIRKKITREKAKQILELNPRDGEFQKKFILLTKGLPDLPHTGDEYKKLRRLLNEEAAKQAKLEKEFAEKTKRMREMTREMNEKIMKPYSQKRAREAMEREIGLNLKDGQRLKFLTDQKNEEYATIKKIIWQEEIETVDENGKPVKHKFPVPQPVVLVESINPATNEITEDKFYTHDLGKWAERNAAVEVIESLGELKTSIGQEVKKGDKLEYRKIIGSDKNSKPLYQDIAVEIRNIFENNNEVELSDSVQTDRGPQKTLTFGEFAKWWKKNEAVKQIESIEKLRQELYAYNTVQNDYYKRPPGQYPPIEVKPEEVLYYDDSRGREFTIKEVKEEQKKIVFTNGEEKSFTSFFRWVKRNEVEKKTAEAEGEKASEDETDPAKKKAKYEAAKAQTEEDMKDNKAREAHPPKDYVFPSTEEVAGPARSYIKHLWRNTKVMSLSDFFVMGKTIVEFIKRKWKRWQEGKVGAVGEWMFGKIPILNALGPEFHGMLKHAEDEEVQHHIKHMEHMSIKDIKHELHHPPNADILKAAITTLCKKGQMRWDDEAFWHALEEWSGVHIRKTHYLEDIEKAIDSLWGQDHFREFRSSQDSQYNSIKDGFKDHAGRLDAVPGSLKVQLQKMLSAFLRGEYVNPAQYEEYIDYSIDAGKMGFEDKIFFIIMGIGAQNIHGETLLATDRAGALDSKYLVKVPILEYFTSPWRPLIDSDGKPIPDPEKPGEFKKGPPNINSFKKVIRDHILPDFGVSSIGEIANMPYQKISWITNGRFVDFVRDEMAFDDWVRYRAEKASRDPSNWDHDDMDMFVHLLDETSIDQIVRYSGGARLQVSFTGLKNAFAGLNEFVKRKIYDCNESAKNGDAEAAKAYYKEVIRMLKAFIRFDATVDRRYAHANDQGKVRFTQDMYNSPPLCAHGTNVIQFIKELRDVIDNLAKATGLGQEWAILSEKLEITDANKNKIAEQQAMVEKFGNMLQGKIQKEYIDKNNIGQLAEVLGQKPLRGLTNKTADKGDAAQREMEEMKQLQLAQQAENSTVREHLPADIKIPEE